MKLLLYSILFLFLLACSEDPKVGGTTVGTGNPQVSWEGTLVKIPKTQINTGEQLSFRLYKANAKPWLDTSAYISASSDGNLIDLDTLHWGLDLSSLNWQGVNEPQTLSNLFISNGEKIQMISGVFFNEDNFTFYSGSNSGNSPIDSFKTQFELPTEWSGTVTYDYMIYSPPTLGFIGTPYITHADIWGNYSFRNLVSNLDSISGVISPLIVGDICRPEPGKECPPDTTNSWQEIQIIGEYKPGEFGNLVIE